MQRKTGMKFGSGAVWNGALRKPLGKQCPFLPMSTELLLSHILPFFHGPLKTTHTLKLRLVLHLQYCRGGSKRFVSIYLGSSMPNNCIQTPCKSETSLGSPPLDLLHMEYSSHLCSIKPVAKCHNALIHR